MTDRLYLAANNGLIVCLHDREYQKPIRHRKGEEYAENPLRIRLDQIIDDLGSAKMPLSDLLANWSKRYPPLQFRIDEDAFKAAERESPARAPVVAPRADRKKLGEILKAVLDQVKCVYEVLDDTVMILPAPAAPAPAP